MSRDNELPFPRGMTFYNGGTIDTNNLGGIQFEGKEFLTEDPRGTGQPVWLKVLRNSGTFNLLPSRIAAADAANYGTRSNGYTTATNQEGWPIDELLPAAGVVPNDLFYGIVEGPCLVLTPLDAGADNVFAAGNPITALTAATSGATTAGRVAALLAAVTNPGLLTVLGRAQAAATTANTGKTLLIYAHRWL